MNNVRQTILRLQQVAPVLDDNMSDHQLSAATTLVDSLDQWLSREEITVLLSLLPTNGDTAFGLNWTILHAIEASEHWPIWELLADEDHEWKEILAIRLKNAGEIPSLGRAN